MTALTDYLLSAHIGYVNASIRGEKPLPFRPLAKLPDPQRTDAQPTAGGIPSPANSQPHGGSAARSFDPFDAVQPTPVAIYRDGREYERDAMQEGRGALAE